MSNGGIRSATKVGGRRTRDQIARRRRHREVSQHLQAFRLRILRRHNACGWCKLHAEEATPNTDLNRLWR
jgi:hypothetical protein